MYLSVSEIQRGPFTVVFETSGKRLQCVASFLKTFLLKLRFLHVTSLISQQLITLTFVLRAYHAICRYILIV